MKLSSTENIPVMDADAIFILLEPDDPAIADNYQHWASHPLWQQLSAVQNDRVYEVDPVSWMMGGGILAANAMLDDLFAHYGLSQPEAAQPRLSTPFHRPCGALSMLNSVSAKGLGLLFGLLMALGAFCASVMLGTTAIAWSSLWAALNHYDPTNVAHIILLTERLPRAVIAALVGASLAIAGALMQTVTRNPLASPGILGINAGAMFLWW